MFMGHVTRCLARGIMVGKSLRNSLADAVGPTFGMPDYSVNNMGHSLPFTTAYDR